VPAAAQSDNQPDTQLYVEVMIPQRTVLHFAGLQETGPTGRTPAADTLTFDLSCATVGSLPQHCHALYGGPLLDTFGRPYPPVEIDAHGRFVSTGNFPQYFEAEPRTLRIFTSESWRLQAELIGMGALGAEHFAVWTDQGQWRCLGWHQDWLEESGRGWMNSQSCPAEVDAGRQAVPVTESLTPSGGWQELTMRLMLRLDGSEPSGLHSGVLRYTLVSF
jgi:hypothetical protein